MVAGERRWRAARLAGQATIPALIDASVDGAGSLELALIENVVREDLTPIEEARTIAILLDDLNVTATELAKRLGRSRTDLAHTVCLLDLPDNAIELIDAGALSKGHGKALLTDPTITGGARSTLEPPRKAGRSEPSKPKSRADRTHAPNHSPYTQTTRQPRPDSRRHSLRRPAATHGPARIVSVTS